LLNLLFDPAYRGSMFLLNVELSPNYTELQPEDRAARSHSRENLKSPTNNEGELGRGHTQETGNCNANELSENCYQTE
jgi:hypothetical protein